MAIAKSSKFDWNLALIVLGLLIYGLIALYSASTVESFKSFGNPAHYVLHQLYFGAFLGILGLYVCFKIDYHFWQKNLFALILISLGALLLVKLSGLSVAAGGATRWLQFGSVSFQPAELAKLVIIFYLASWADRKRKEMNDFYNGLLPLLCIVGLFAALILSQPDFGTMIILVTVAAAMLFVAGIDWKYFFWTAAAVFLGLYGLIKFEPYRAKRLTTFFNPGVDPQGISYHINQALLAVGSGQWWGYGYGLSRQKHNYLPEVMNDSIFAVTAEELGFVRVVIILLLFGLFAFKGYSIAKSAPDLFGKMTAFGLTSWIVLQALINIGAMVNLLPLTGIPLPFFSYGSTALILNLSAVGILLNISSFSK